MLLSSSPHSAEKFSPTIASGLRSLLVPPTGGGVIVTRSLAAASRGCRGAGVKGSRDDRESIIGGDDEEDAKAEEQDVMIKAEDDEDGGCWVSYGRREPRRRLPPPIPSLLAGRGTLWRTRTKDGRLVIRIAPVVWAECIHARRRGGRLTMQLVEHDDESPLTLPAPTAARQDDVGALDEPQDDTAAPAVTGEGVDHNGTAAAATDFGSEGIDDDAEEAEVAAQQTTLPVVPPPRVPSAGCFEDVFKYSSIGGSSLHKIMPSLRMVH